jgi:DNA repair ATPase RecN
VSKRLLKRVKADNNEIKELDKRITKLKKLINNYKKDLKDIEIDKAGKNDT